jgi:hypothetical protein
MCCSIRDGSFRRGSPPSPAALVGEPSSPHSHSSQHLPSLRCEAPAVKAERSAWVVYYPSRFSLK